MGIQAYVPLPDWEEHSRYFGAATSPSTPSRTSIAAPQGPLLRPYRRGRGPGPRLYLTAAHAAMPVPLKPQCTPSDQGRHLHRSFAEAYSGPGAQVPVDAAYAKALRKRQVWVEPLFAEGKPWHGLRRFRWRRYGA